MRKALILGLLTTSIAVVAAAEDKPVAAGVAPLTKAQCEGISRRSDGSFFVKGRITIGTFTFVDQEVTPHGMSIDGVDAYDVILRSCFSAKPL